MEPIRYEVLVDGVVVGQEMELHYATILVSAIFEKYYNEPQMEVTVRRSQKKEGLECENRNL